MNLTRIRNVCCVAVLLTVSIASTGCMLTPGNNENISSIYSPVNFSGVTQNPNEYVFIYARPDSSASWHYIGWAKTSSTPINYFGTDWYFWQRDMVVPVSDWTIGSWFSACQVKAETPTGSELLTWDTGFYGYYDEYDNLSDLWNDHGHDTYATILAGN